MSMLLWSSKQPQGILIRGSRIEQTWPFPLGQRGELVLVRPMLRHDVSDRPISRQQCIRDHRPVAAPGHRLGAHDDCGGLRCRRH